MSKRADRKGGLIYQAKMAEHFVPLGGGMFAIGKKIADINLGPVFEPNVRGETKKIGAGGKGSAIITLLKDEEAKRNKELILIFRLKHTRDYEDSYALLHFPTFLELLKGYHLHCGYKIKEVDKDKQITWRR